MTASKKREPIIEVKHLSKKYDIGVDTAYRTLSESVTSAVRHPIKTLKDFHKKNETFWALKDVNFEVKQGEALGIIGKNGAGKSTLLKVLSRITHPTEGEVIMRGRVGSLLEVGTGFHPELSGRENIYFNGAILGMKKKEIDEKFDEIVKFSGVEKFLDTPVKRYSSGMQVRLAFSVAAHLDPEILVVDEVLAVGDAVFQKKCLGKMNEVAERGRTVLFVSHNMGAISELCDTGILLEEGKVIVNDSIEKTLSYYSGFNKLTSLHYASSEKSNKPYFKEITIIQADNTSTNVLDIDKAISIKFDIETYGKKELVVSIVIRNKLDICVHHSSDEFNNLKSDLNSSLRICEIPSYALSDGIYYLDVYIAQRNYELFQEISNVLAFEVQFCGIVSDRTTSEQWKGICGPGLLKWV